MIIYQPVLLTSPINAEVVTINAASVGISIPLQITDTPPIGVMSEFDITQSTVKTLYAIPFNNAAGSMVTLAGAIGLIGSSTTMFTYSPDSTDMTALAGYSWRLAMLITFANGENVYVNSQFVFTVSPDNTIASTMDVTTPVGAVRFLLRDNDMSTPFFTDAEISYMLQCANEYTPVHSTVTVTLNMIYYAASLGYTAMAADAAFYAQTTKAGVYSIDTSTAQKALMGMSATYKTLAQQETVPYLDSSQIGWPLVPYVPGLPYYGSNAVNSDNPWPVGTTIENQQEW